jgi:hypothetical protein
LSLLRFVQSAAAAGEQYRAQKRVYGGARSRQPSTESG